MAAVKTRKRGCDVELGVTAGIAEEVMVWCCVELQLQCITRTELSHGGVAAWRVAWRYCCVVCRVETEITVLLCGGGYVGVVYAGLLRDCRVESPYSCG